MVCILLQLDVRKIMNWGQNHFADIEHSSNENKMSIAASSVAAAAYFGIGYAVFWNVMEYKIPALHFFMKEILDGHSSM